MYLNYKTAKEAGGDHFVVPTSLFVVACIKRRQAASSR